MSENTVEVSFGGDASGAIDAANEAKDKVKEALDQIKDGLTSSTAAAVAFGEIFARIGEKIAESAKDMMREAVSAYAELGDQVEHMQHRLGGSAQEMSALKAGLDSVGISTSTFEAVARRLPQILETNSEKLDEAGVAYKDADGNILSAKETIINLTEHLEKFSAGSARNMEGVRLMGRAYYSMADMVEMTKSRMAEAQVVADEFGLTLSERDVEAADDFGRSTSLLQQALHGFYVQVGRALTPALIELANGMREVLVPAFSAFKVVVETVAALLGGVYVSFVTVASGVAALGASLKLTVDLMGALMTAMTGNPKKAMAEVNTAVSEYKATISNLGGFIENEVNRVNAGMDRLHAPPGKGEAEKPEKFKKEKNDEEKAAAPKSRMGEWSAELDQMRVAYQLEHDLREMSKKEELQFWQSKKAGPAEELALKRKVAETMLADMKNERAEGEKKRDETIANEKAVGMARIESEKETLRLKKEMGEIDNKEHLAALQELENQAYKLELATINEKLKLYKEDEAAYQKLMNQKTLLAEKHALEIKKLDDNIKIESKKNAQEWLQPITNAVEKSVTGMIQGTLTLKKALSNIYQSILGEFVSMIVKRTIAWTSGEVAKTAATHTGNAARVASDEAAAGQSLLITAGTAIKQILIYAWEAMAGAFQALVGIPYVGPFLAAGAAAAAFATVSGIAGSISSAAGGYDIPSGVNPITQLHQNEMVLPEKHANVIRGLADSGATPNSGGGNSAGSGDVHLHVHSMDTKGVRDWFRKNHDALAPALRRSARNASPTAITSSLGKVY